MAIIKCKMCGGDIELAADKTYGMCEFCGSTMTFPKVDDDQRAAAFNRGNHFRRIGEFDKALAVYERIVREDDTDAEAHWCCALCRFGIEYVEDPATYEYLPTCHRASFDSFLEDVDYLAAVEHSDGVTKRQYQRDAAKIAEVQRGILAASQNAEPYDVFICYKESDENGNRTRDSLLAQDIYYQMTEQGRKVFFARITLEDVAGTQYEPYIFAALNSAKVMIVVGTKSEYLNAVWVKNEWSRFLAMMKKDRHKLLLPCYRDMDPYDMPEQLSVLQSYDMGKIGFIQDLTRGITKVLDADKKSTAVKETVVVQQNSAPAANTSPLLKRAFMFLEDGDWNSANEYCEKALDIDPECAQAYLGKLMAELKVRSQEALRDQAEPFDNASYYKKAILFSDDQMKAALNGYIEHINNRLKEEKEKCSFLFKAFKEAFANEKHGINTADVNKKLSSLNDQYKTLSGLKDDWQQIENEERALNEKIKPIQAEIDALNSEKTDIGIFAVKRKKEIAERLTNLNRKQYSVNQEIGILQKKKQGHKSIAGIDETMNSLGEQIDAQRKILEELECAISSQSLREELSNYELGKKLLRRFDASTVGNYIKFGTYEQDNTNNKETIEWLVLDVKDGKTLLISKYALDCIPFDTSRMYVTWDTCTLRKWLNDNFVNTAFTADEKTLISTVTLSKDKNPRKRGSLDNTTLDQVFLLNTNEVEKYFKSEEARWCKPTNFAVANGAYVNKNTGNCWWWMRTNYDCIEWAPRVSETGFLTVGNYAKYNEGAVRPALWIDLSKITD